MDNSFLHRKKLLLVDDEPDLLKMVSDFLSDAGFETVLTAATVKEAIITAEKEKPDLMVLDVMLPDGDGFSLMKQLRTFTNVPIIFLTAKEHTLLETLARNEGKIVTVDALCEALWGDNPFGYENSLNAHVRRIREKIEADPSKPVSLITIKGLGYKLITRK